MQLIVVARTAHTRLELLFHSVDCFALIREADNLDLTQFLCCRTALKQMVVRTTLMIKISILVLFLPCMLQLIIRACCVWHRSPGVHLYLLTAPLAYSHYAGVHSPILSSCSHSCSSDIQVVVVG